MTFIYLTSEYLFSDPFLTLNNPVYLALISSTLIR